uniref:15-hydroxyprostaglandin dehydrogenase [NAD(+)] n=1 Tax=Caligus clemensi TaxID=344056 RepID=C1C276_CALCM|nr:15-hydroxyprostaglandin dehydrogenase [Caligus clemensi]
MKDSVVIITGSAKGLGKGFAGSLLKKGCFVALSDVIQEDGLKTLKEFREVYGENKVLFVPADVRSKEGLEYLWNETEAYFGRRVNVFVNNAGVNERHPGCLDINLYGTMTGVEVAYERLEKGSHIINIASMAGLVPGIGNKGNNYFVSKRGVVTLTRVLGGASKSSGIQCSSLCPYFVDTDLVRESGIVQDINTRGGQILTVDRVVEGFDALFENPNVYNGKALAVTVNCPFFTMPIYNWTFLVWLVTGAGLMRKIFPKMQIYNTRYQGMFIALSFGLLFLLLELLLRFTSFWL